MLLEPFQNKHDTSVENGSEDGRFLDERNSVCNCDRFNDFQLLGKKQEKSMPKMIPKMHDH